MNVIDDSTTKEVSSPMILPSVPSSKDSVFIGREQDAKYNVNLLPDSVSAICVLKLSIYQREFSDCECFQISIM